MSPTGTNDRGKLTGEERVAKGLIVVVLALYAVFFSTFAFFSEEHRHAIRLRESSAERVDGGSHAITRM